MKKTKIISGFPGIGKSYFYNNNPLLKISDSDSSTFDKSDFPQNYIKHIKKLYQARELDFILVSSHKNVRDALIDANLPYTLIYPEKYLRDEYIQRYVDRESPEAFIKLLKLSFFDWVDDCKETFNPLVKQIVLTSPEDNLTTAIFNNNRNED